MAEGEKLSPPAREQCAACGRFIRRETSAYRWPGTTRWCCSLVCARNAFEEIGGQSSLLVE